jgi:hypothetical protein
MPQADAAVFDLAQRLGYFIARIGISEKSFKNKCL